MFRTSMAITPTAANFAPLLFAGEWQRGLDTAIALGYDAVEVSLRDPQEDIVQNLMGAIQSSPLRLSAIATAQSYLHDGLSLSSTDGPTRDRVVARLSAVVDLAATMGALVILGSIRGKLEGSEEDRQMQRQFAVQSVQRVASYAAKAGVSLLLEPINRYETNFLNTVGQVLEFVAQVGSDNVLVLTDTFHLNIEEVSITGALREAGDRLGYVHLVDTNRRAPGQGHLDIESVAKTLHEMGYSGYVSAEILPWPDSATAAKWALECYRQL